MTSDGRNGHGTTHAHANEEMRLLWQESLTARVRLIEEQIDQMQKQLNALRESLEGVVTP